MNSQLKARLQRIQKALGVNPDGILGPLTLTALEHRLTGTSRPSLAAITLPESEAHLGSLVVSRKSIDLIVQEEIGSYAYYTRNLQHPYWPGGRSGVTIGIGYDLGAQSKKKIRSDWRGKISDADLDLLCQVSGISGVNAKKAAKSIRAVSIPLDVAKEVFFTIVLPRYAKDALQAFPGLEKLQPDAQGAILSLGYNRGFSLKGSRRSEMREIKRLIPEMDYRGIAEQLKAMKRLWDSDQSGLPGRRDKEADLTAYSERTYSADELVYL